MSVSIVPFGVTSAGEEVHEIVLKNEYLTVGILDYGAILHRIVVPSRSGAPVDVCLGYQSVQGYETESGSMGAVVGRFANRIGGARFVIDGQTYQLPANEGQNLLHGGHPNFGQRMFQYKQLGPCEVCLTLHDPDGSCGFPGNMDLQVFYSLTAQGVQLCYRAQCDKPTPINMTNHAYFNLAGQGSLTVLDHVLTLAASRYTPADEGNIPTGELAPVAGTAFDFTTPHTLGERLNDPILAHTRGYDQNYALDGEGLRPVARLYCPSTGICMETVTDQPGLQVYSGDFLQPASLGKGGVRYQPLCAVCLETQDFPDCINHPQWGDFILRPGQEYVRTTAYNFSVE